MQDLMLENTSTDNRAFMALVREACEQMGIRQKDLAASLDLKQSQMNLYFQGKVEMRTERLLPLLKILGIDVEQQIQEKVNLAKGNDPSKTSSSEGKILALWGGLPQTQKNSMARILAQLSNDRVLKPEGTDNEALESVKKELRRDHLFTVFGILPEISNDLPTIMRLSKKVGILPEIAEKYLYSLLSAGLWSVNGSKVQRQFELFDAGDSSPQEFLSFTADLISRINDNQAFNYDAYTLVTNRSLVRSFAGKVNQGLKDLYLKTETDGLEKNCIFSWSHAGVINLEFTSPNQKNVETLT